MNIISKKFPKTKSIPDGFFNRDFYITKDGKEFSDKRVAERHEDQLDFYERYHIKQIEVSDTSYTAALIIELTDEVFTDFSKHIYKFKPHESGETKMKSCEHQRHPVITFLIYLITGLALFFHMLSHMLPIVLLCNSKFLIQMVENPIVTCVALLFIPLSFYHLWRDKQMHETIHRLTKERDELRDEINLDYP